MTFLHQNCVQISPFTPAHCMLYQLFKLPQTPLKTYTKKKCLWHKHVQYFSTTFLQNFFFASTMPKHSIYHKRYCLNMISSTGIQLYNKNYNILPAPNNLCWNFTTSNWVKTRKVAILHHFCFQLEYNLKSWQHCLNTTVFVPVLIHFRTGRG